MGGGYGMLSDIDPTVGGAFALDKFRRARKGYRKNIENQNRRGTLEYIFKPKASDYGTPPSYFNAVPTPEYSQPSMPSTDFIRNPPATERATGRKYTKRRGGGDTVGTYGTPQVYQERKRHLNDWR